MKKEDHLKIVEKLESQIQVLQNRIAELSAESSKFAFDLKIQQVIADQRRELINKMLSSNLKNLNYMLEYDKKNKDMFQKYVERIEEDNQKFDALIDYIKKTFPQAVMPAKDNPDKFQAPTDENLSQTFIGQNGEIYSPHHVVDLAIMIMNSQYKKLKEILGQDDFGFENNNGED